MHDPGAEQPDPQPNAEAPTEDAGTPGTAVPTVATEPGTPEVPGAEEISYGPGMDEDVPYSASARLGVLRKLFFGPGFTPEHADSEPEVRVEREAGRSTYARGSFGPAESTMEAEAVSNVSVTAQPEFLRPRQAAPVEKEKEKEPLRTVPTPVRRDTADDIETLPSWRGQYRKKRYPTA